MTNDHLELWACFAGLDTLVPRVVKFCVTSTSTVFEPRTSATATTDFPGFRDGAAFGTHVPDGRRRRNYWYLCVGIGQKERGGNYSCQACIYNMYTTFKTKRKGSSATV